MHVSIRYDTPDGQTIGADYPRGMTRRERNSAALRCDLNPDADIDPHNIYLVEWFWALRKFKPDSETPLVPSDVREWMADTGNVINRAERGIIYEIDHTYRTTLAAEIKSNTDTMNQRREAEGRT